MGLTASVASVSLSARASSVAGSRVVALPQSTSAPARFSFNVEAAHKKGTGSTKNGRDSNPQYLGVKKYGGEVVQTGNIIIRQRGNKVTTATGVGWMDARRTRAIFTPPLSCLQRAAKTLNETLRKLGNFSLFFFFCAGRWGKREGVQYNIS